MGKPPAGPDRDIGSGDFLEGGVQPAHGALVPLAGGSLGQAQFDEELSRRFQVYPGAGLASTRV